MFNSARLTFTLITHEDHNDVRATLNDQNTCEMLSFMRWPLTDEQVTYWCDKAVEGAKEESEYLFIARNGHRAIGCIGIHKDQDEPTKAEIGYWVSPNHQRQGYANEMLVYALDYAQNDLGIKNFYATADNENPASANLLIKHDFIESGEKLVESQNNAPRPSKLFTR
jgi:ribosomal-protein-alanine N-acetyltransferase